MKTLSLNEKELRLQCQGKERFGNAFIFDIELLPLDLKPKHIVFEYKAQRRFHEFKMTWRKLGRQDVIGNTVVIAKELFTHYIDGHKVWGRMT